MDDLAPQLVGFHEKFKGEQKHWLWTYKMLLNAFITLFSQELVPQVHQSTIINWRLTEWYCYFQDIVFQGK